VIHNFAGPRYGGPDGGAPLGGLVFDAAGNLYGTTLLSGEHDYGAVFELSPGPGATWTEQLIHSFTGNDGCDPQARLIIDSAGNLYGTTYSQGATYETCGGWGHGLQAHSWIGRMDGDGVAPVWVELERWRSSERNRDG
jgi:hypothetical protein